MNETRHQDKKRWGGERFFAPLLCLVALSGCEDEEQKKRDALELETRKTDVTHAIVKCDGAFAEVANAHTKEGLTPSDRYGFIAQGLERASNCLHGVEKELEAAGSMDLEYEPGKTAAPILGPRLARVDAELALIQEIDREKTKWFVSDEGVVFLTDEARQRAEKALSEYRSAHAKLQSLADPKWHSELLWGTAPHLLSSSSGAEPNWKASGVTAEMAAEFLALLKEKHEDAQAFAKLAQYPLSYQEGLDSFQDEDELLTIYERGIRDYMAKALADAGPAALYADSTGVAVDRGTLWFGCPQEKCEAASELRMTQLNPRK